MHLNRYMYVQKITILVQQDAKIEYFLERSSHRESNNLKLYNLYPVLCVFMIADDVLILKHL